jgi:predicted nucleic acid-binding protein
MAKDLIIVDSCVLIKAFRKDALANNDLKGIINCTAYSVITLLELLIGANTLMKKRQLLKSLNPITESL